MAKPDPKLPPAVPPEIPPSPADASSTRQPKFETPKVAEGEQVPRVIPSIERAPKGLTRFKIRANKSLEGAEALYILAKNKADAEACFWASQPEHLNEHKRQTEAWERAGKPGLAPPPPELIVTELPD